jgi:heterodisulfide reductase subunit A2
MTNEPLLPRAGVYLCECGGQISKAIDLPALYRMVQEMPGVAQARVEAYPCSKDGRQRIRQDIAQGVERVLIAGCAPRLVEKLFRESAAAAGLDPSYVHIANIREQCAFSHPGSSVEACQKAASLIEMGLARLATTTPAVQQIGRLVRSVLVVGHGLSALTVALSLADSGIRVVLYQPASTSTVASPGFEPRTPQLAAEKAESAAAHPMIDTFLNARIVEVSGHPGDYQVRFHKNGGSSGEGYETHAFGAIVIANNAQAKPLTGEQWFDREKVKTQAEFQAELEETETSASPLALADLVFILCADPDQSERCSRVCCNAGIRQAIQAKQLNPEANITVLFRDLYFGGTGEDYENEFHKARRMGITFFRYQKGNRPVIRDEQIDVIDTLTGEPLHIPFDRVILSMPLIPEEGTTSLSALFSLPLDEGGFLAEPRVRLRPGRFADPGIYVLGSAHQPADTTEALFQAYLTSSRVLQFLSRDNISVDTPIAVINPNLCTGCGNCSNVCPTNSIQLEKRDGILSLSRVDALRCIGCGNCVVVCPVKAINLPGWDHMEIPAQISAALKTPSGAWLGPIVVVLACEWSAYSAADMLGKINQGNGGQGLGYPASVRFIRMNCSARFDPYHILWAFLNGAQGVYLGACPPGECHYGTGNLYAEERVEILKKGLARHGIDPRRLHLEFLTLDEPQKLAGSLQKFLKDIR